MPPLRSLQPVQRSEGRLTWHLSKKRWDVARTVSWTMMDIIQFGSFWNSLDLKSLRLLNLLDAAAHDCLSRAHIHTIPGWTTCSRRFGSRVPSLGDLSKRRLDDENGKLLACWRLLKYLHVFAWFFPAWCVFQSCLLERSKKKARKEGSKKEVSKGRNNSVEGQKQHLIAEGPLWKTCLHMLCSARVFLLLVESLFLLILSLLLLRAMRLFLSWDCCCGGCVVSAIVVWMPGFFVYSCWFRKSKSGGSSVSSSSYSLTVLTVLFFSHLFAVGFWWQSFCSAFFCVIVMIIFSVLRVHCTVQNPK